MTLELICGDVMRQPKINLRRTVDTAPRNSLLTIVTLSLFIFALPIRATRADELNPPQATANVDAVSAESSATPSDSESAKKDSESAKKDSESAKTNSESAKKTVTPAPSLAPEKFRDVDDAAKLLIWLVVSCGLGMLVLLCVIVLGAKRMRRLTQSKLLKSKYDELEFLRLKHRREADGLAPPDEPKTEIR